MRLSDLPFHSARAEGSKIPGVQHKSQHKSWNSDDQSSGTFADPSLFAELGLDLPLADCSLHTLSGEKYHQKLQVAHNLVVRGVRSSRSFTLPKVYENQMIPDTKSEVATPEVVSRFPAL